MSVSGRMLVALLCCVLLSVQVVSASPDASSTEVAAESAVAAEAEGVAAIEKRVLARWDALTAGDFESAYQFELPSFRRLFGFDAFRSRFGAQPHWAGVRINRIERDAPGRAKVSVSISQSILISAGTAPETAVSSMEEVWLNRDDNWWIVMPLDAGLGAATPRQQGVPAGDVGSGG